MGILIMEKLHFFFATKSDLLSNLVQLETSLDLHYVLAGQFDSKIPKQYSSLLDIDDLGITKATEPVLCNAYLVLFKKVKAKFQRVFLRKGGIQYAYDQGKNPNSIVFRPGGLYQKKCLLAGCVDTIGDTNASIDLFKRFSKLLTKEYYVGPDAMALLKSGMRLVSNRIDQPKEYDLVLE